MLYLTRWLRLMGCIENEITGSQADLPILRNFHCTASLQNQKIGGGEDCALPKSWYENEKPRNDTKSDSGSFSLLRGAF